MEIGTSGEISSGLGVGRFKRKIGDKDPGAT